VTETQVLLKKEGILKKLGTFTIKEVTAYQNYNLIDATGTEHSRSVPLHKLKIINTSNPDNVEEVKKILDFAEASLEKNTK